MTPAVSRIPHRQHRAGGRNLILIALPAFIVLLGFGARLFHLQSQSLWFDEGWSWHLARLPLADMAAATAADRSPFLYYALLHVWLKFAGESEFAMRYLSLMADVATVALVMVIARAFVVRPTSLLRQPAPAGLSNPAAVAAHIADLAVRSERDGVSQTRQLLRARPSRHWGGWVAGLLYAVCPFAVWYAQETRMYALVSALCALSSYWLLRWLGEQGAGRNLGSRALALSAVFLAAAVYCHYYAIFLLPAHAVVVLLAVTRPAGSVQDAAPDSQTPLTAKDAKIAKDAKSAKSAENPSLHLSSLSPRSSLSSLAAWLVSAVLVVLSLVPWLLAASAGFAYDDGFAFPLNTVGGRFAEWVTALASGGLARPLPDGWLLVLAASAVAAALGFLVAGRPRELVMVVALIVLPVLAATIAVRVFYPYRSVFHPRYLVYVVPAVCVFLAGAVGNGASLPRRLAQSRLAPWLAAVAVALALVLWAPALVALYTDPSVARDDVRAATRHVAEALEPGDLVIMTRDNYAVRYYYPMFTAQRPVTRTQLIAMPAGLHGVLSDDTQLLGAINAFGPQRIRLLLWQDDVVDPQKIVESTLWPSAYQIGEYNFGSIRLPLYRVTQLPADGVSWTPVQASFGDQLELTGFWASPQSYAGDWFYVILRWTPLRPPAADYRVFVHVLDAQGQMRFQKDKQPLNDLLPMTRWPVGRSVRDAYALVAPQDLPPGDYQVVMGVYEAGGARLPVRSAQAAATHDAVVLGTLRVVSR